MPEDEPFFVCTWQPKGAGGLMDVETSLGELIAKEKIRGENFERERERERARWSKIGENYS